GITKPTNSIKYKHSRVVKLCHSHPYKSYGSYYVQQNSNPHRFSWPITFCHNPRKPRGNSYSDTIHGKKRSRLLNRHTMLDEIGTKPSLLHAIPHHEY